MNCIPILTDDPNQQWRINPCAVINIPQTIDALLFIDESGKPTYKNMGDDIWFTLCGCLFENSSITIAKDTFMAIKNRYWINGCYFYKKGPQRVVFHMKEIAPAIKGLMSIRNNPFCSLGDRFPAFYYDLCETINQLDFTVFSVTVNKYEMQQKYNRFAYDPYEYAMKLMLERVNHYMAVRYGHGGHLSVFVECVGLREANISHANIMKVISDGTEFLEATRFKWLNSVYFCPKRPEPDKSYYGLEVADFCAYPIRIFCSKQIKSSEFLLIEKKIFHPSKASSYGLKKVP